MEKIRVSSQNIIDLLECWQRGDMSESDVYDWAENHSWPGYLLLFFRNFRYTGFEPLTAWFR